MKYRPSGGRTAAAGRGQDVAATPELTDERGDMGTGRPQPRPGGASRVNWRCVEPLLCANWAGHAIGPAQLFLAWRGALPR